MTWRQIVSAVGSQGKLKSAPVLLGVVVSERDDEVEGPDLSRALAPRLRPTDDF
jgi:hypothetical protein